ncbi:MAG: DUF6318 family protein [Jatrophihabitantaceae bacterium]
MMMIMRRAGGLIGFVISALTILTVAACTSGSATPNLSPVFTSPSVASSSAGSLSASPSVSAAYPADVPLTGHNVRPGEKPPRYPANAAARTQAGANAFAEFFMRTLDWAYATTNPSYVRHYIGPTCGLCSGIATGITKTAASHHFYEGGRFTVRPAIAAAIAPVKAPADFCSLITLNVSAESVVDTTGKIINGDQAYKDLKFKLCVKFDGPNWQATYLSRI